MEGKVISRGDQHLIAPAEQHDYAAAENVKSSPLLPEGSVEPPHLPPLSSKLHGLMKKNKLCARQMREGRDAEMDNL